MKYLIFALFLFTFSSTLSNASNIYSSKMKTLKFLQDEGEIIKLPQPRYKSDFSIEECLLLRRSIREYKKEPLTLAEVSQILWAAYGINEEIDNPPAYLRGGLKTAPSAGALYPLEIYLVAGEVTGLEKGVYKYITEDHALQKVQDGDIRADLCNAGLDQDMIEDAPADLVFSGIYSRTTIRYGERGRLKYVPIDVGHAGQNVYLQAIALGIGTCAIGAFDDEMVKMVMEFPEEEEPMYIMPLGKVDY